MELKEAITKGFEVLESKIECNWPSNKRITREKLIEAFSQLELKPYVYLNYKTTNGLAGVMRRAVPKLHSLKSLNQEFRHFLLGLSDSFLCYKCLKLVNIVNNYNRSCTKYICKQCELQQKQRLRLEGRLYINNYLKDNPCMDCGETNIIVLEFDHKDRSTKTANIADLVTKRKRLLEEIDKCDVVCANCHRIRTAKQLNYYAYLDNE